MNRYDDKYRALAVGFAFLAGFLDASGFLMSGGLFISFMTGNSTRLALGLTEVTAFARQAALLIGLFVLGVMANVLFSTGQHILHRKVAAAAELRVRPAT